MYGTHLTVEHDRSCLHQSSEPKACGGDGMAEAGDVNGGNPFDLTTVLDHADTEGCQAQGATSSQRLHSELEQQARKEYTCLRSTTAPQRETATEAAPDKHETGALSRRPESLPMAHKPTKPAMSPILFSLVMYSPPNSLNVKVSKCSST